MKNMKKFVAAFAAAAMVMSMGVSAFAAPELVEGNTKLTFASGDFKDGQAQVTMMAYVVEETGLTPATAPDYDPEDETMVMIALDQDSAIPDVKVDASKIKEGTTVVIKTSGSKGEVQKFVLEQAVTPTGKVVTFMNGADAVTLTSVDGKVTLPTDVEWNGGEAAPGYAFELYSWVAEDGTEYKLSEVTEITGIEEEVTLYAKYNTGIVNGDVDFDNEVTEFDSQLINYLAFDGDNYMEDTMGKPIYEGSDLIIGDVDFDGEVTEFDSQLINYLAFDGDNYMEDTMTKTIYIINGSVVEVVYAD